MSTSTFIVLKRILAYAQPHRLRLVQLALVSLALIGSSLLQPWPMKILVDNVIGGKPLFDTFSTNAPQPTSFSLDYVLAIIRTTISRAHPSSLLMLTGVAVATILLFIAHGALDIWSTALDLHVGQGLLYQLKSDLFEHLQHLSLLYHESKPLGDSIYRVTADTYAAESLVLGGLLPLLTSTISLASMVAILFALDWQLTLIALIILPFLYLSVRYYAARITPNSERVKELESGITAIASEVLSNMRVVQSFARERHEKQRFDRQVQQSVRARVALTMQETRFHYLVDLATVAGTAVVLWLGGYHILQGQLTLGGLLVFLGYLGSAYAPLNSISGTLTGMQEAMTSARRVFEVLDTEVMVSQAAHTRPLKRVHGNVRFEHVTFAYRKDKPTLQDVSFDVGAGDVVGIVGLSGAGKTTLASLILRLFDPDHGRILIDAHDIRNVQLQSLREQVSIVLQEPVLFSTSVRDNIAYGKPDATKDEIVKAAKRAGAHAFIRELPEGYHSAVGERGAQLSMGQRQRIAIARAFLKDAPILILDEPTAAMDAQNEALILDALNGLMRGRTTFIIAHRFSTIRSANKILVLQAGRLIESGSHEALMARGGLYRHLYRLQTSFPAEPGAKAAR